MDGQPVWRGEPVSAIAFASGGHESLQRRRLPGAQLMLGYSLLAGIQCGASEFGVSPLFRLPLPLLSSRYSRQRPLIERAAARCRFASLLPRAAERQRVLCELQRVEWRAGTARLARQVRLVPWHVERVHGAVARREAQKRDKACPCWRVGRRDSCACRSQAPCCPLQCTQPVVCMHMARGAYGGMQLPPGAEQGYGMWFKCSYRVASRPLYTHSYC